MKTLEDAWQWYSDVKATLKRMNRMGDRYWDRIPWETPPWKGDRHFGLLSKADLIRAGENGLEQLDDLAIVVLFSVFEAIVRSTVLDEINMERPEHPHRAIVEAIRRAENDIGEGSFFAVLKSFKGADDNLIEEVNQVRRFRNWVSHGKRGPEPASVTPNVAFDRLKRCLILLFPPIPDSWVAMGAYYVWEEASRPGAKDAIHWHKAKIHLQELIRTGQIRLPS